LLTLGEFQEKLLCLHKTISDGFDRILREVLILDDELVEIVSQEVSAAVAAMAVVNSEKGAFGPFLTSCERLALRTHNVEIIATRSSL